MTPPRIRGHLDGLEPFTRVAIGDVPWPTAALDDLLAAYRAARAATNARAGAAEADHCRYCGLHWIPWAGTKLDGHASCAVTLAFKEQLLAWSESDTTLTHTRLADALGVGIGTIRKWVLDAMKARRTR